MNRATIRPVPLWMKSRRAGQRLRCAVPVRPTPAMSWLLDSMGRILALGGVVSDEPAIDISGAAARSPTRRDPGHPDEQKRHEEDRAEDRAELPELARRDIPTAVIDRARSRAVRGDDPHDSKTQQEQERELLHRQALHGRADAEHHRQ